jgi:hypothetical protein
VEDGLIRHRISLLAFDEAKVLNGAAHDLMLNGFSPNEFCLLGACDDRLECVRQSRGVDGLAHVLAGLWAGPPYSLRLDGSAPIAMRCGGRAASLFEATDPVTGPQVVTPHWVRPGLSHSLALSLADDCIILLVASSTAKQHALGAKLLLRHGKHDLQTHEFSVRHAI